MRSKVLELLNTVLETSSIKRIFYGCDDKTIDGCPIKILSLYTHFNKDEKTKPIEIETLKFHLKFKDDDPIIYVQTFLKVNITKELYKTKLFGLIKEYTKIYNYTTETKISFGDFSFILSPEEESQLIETTKQSYAKHLTLIKYNFNKKLLLTVNKQLGYYGGAREN